MTVIILSSTTSSPDVSLASNLQCDTVLLRSASATSAESAVGEMSPHANKLCNEDNAADVMGPVDRGERIMAKNGANSSVSGIAETSS
jgi:hypothetical protein